LNNEFSFSGRLSRKPFFIRFLILVLLGFIIGVLQEFFGENLVILIPLIPLVLLNLSIMVRRLHDMNLHGLLVVGICALQFIANAHSQTAGVIIFTLVTASLMLPKGTTGANKYGNDPLEEKRFNKGCD
jgi:uncharacterized membrane protein YhaH (DUF805 family)